MASDEAKISEAEVELYDRQIRIWGVEAQRRLKGSVVVITGESGIAAEVAKNLILAGIGAVHLIVLTGQTHRRALGNFLPNPRINPEGYRAALAELNPTVTVTMQPCKDHQQYHDAILHAIHDIHADCIVLAGQHESLQQAIQINHLTRAASANNSKPVRFFMAKTAGLSAMFFSDMYEYEYVLKQQTGQSIDQDTAATSGDLNPVKVAYSSLESVLTLDQKSFHEQVKKSMSSKMSKRAMNLFANFVYLIKLSSSPEGDVDKEKLASQISVQYGVNLNVNALVNAEKMWNKELPALSGVIGGLLAQEILKSATRDSKPLKNFVLFDSLSTEALVLSLDSNY